MRLLVIAGELSGDRFAAALASHILKGAPNSTLYGVGGPELKALSHEFIYEIAHAHSVGIWERLHYRRHFKDFYRQLERFLEATVIDKVVLVDFGHHNFKLATLFQRHNIPIYTYITPNFWIWKDKKSAQRLVAYSTHIITVFKDEYAFYKQFTDNVRLSAHPYGEMLEKVGPQKRDTLTFFPGSRLQEIQRLWPVMCQSLKQIQQSYKTLKVVVAVSSPHFIKDIQDRLDAEGVTGIELSTGDQHKLLARTRCLVCAAGSATLEGIFYQTPMVILGKLSWLTYLMVTVLYRIKVPFIGLPNLIMGKAVVPELRQSEVTVKAIVREVEGQINRDQEDIETDYAPIKKRLFKEGLSLAESAARLLAD